MNKSLSKGKIAVFIALGVVALLAIATVIYMLVSRRHNAHDNELPPGALTGVAETEEKTETATGEEPLPTAAESDEIRGLFIASVGNINFPSRPNLSETQLKAELDQIVANAVRAGLNAIYLQVRPTGDALYDSSVFPTSRYLVKEEGAPLVFDPLAYFASVCRQANVSPYVWLNPYRVINTQFADKEAALAALAESNPARQHPDWCVFYGGKLFYDPALPEVRDLIVSGVGEILDRYDVDGVIYDDYFYPYPVSGEEFDDDASYYQYGNGAARDDWRRENVNELIRRTHERVKAAGEDKTFIVSPFGIWRNSSADPRGSKTRGLDSYASLYCDALAWIREGSVDVLAPQLYWERGYEIADFAELTRWWSAQADGTTVKIAPALAIYRVESFKLGAEEIIQQIQFSRAYKNNCGFLLYGYPQLAQDTGGLATKLNEFLAYSYSAGESYTGSAVKGVSFRFPRNGYTTTLSGVFVLGASDPKTPVKKNGLPVGRTKSGFFTEYMDLNYGENYLTVEQNGVTYTLRVVRISGGGGTSSAFAFQSLSPDRDEAVSVRSGASFIVTLTAPALSSVSVNFNGQTTRLSASGSGAYQTYTGVITAPRAEGTEPQKIGPLVYTCTRDGASVSASSGAVTVIPEGVWPVATATKDYAFLKTGTKTSFYDDYLNTNKGMQDELVEQRGDFYRLSFGGWINKDNVSVEDRAEPLPDGKMTAAGCRVNGDRFEVLFTVNRAVPLDVKMEGSDFRIRLFGLDSEGVTPVFAGNPLFTSIGCKADGKDTLVTLTLVHLDNFYGWDYSYTEEGILFSFAMPRTLPEGEKPLEGKTVIVDPGHGGTDTGALGFLAGLDEKNLNLTVALAVAEKLRSMGAEVIMTRTDDSTVSLYERMDLYDEIHPDFAISIHHNSVAETTDASKGRGVWGLYWAFAGRGLTVPLQESLAEALGTYSFGSKPQELAVCRNYKFPQTLLELGFICSPPEYERALRGDYAEVCADAVARGVLRYYENQGIFLEGGTPS